MEIQIPVFGETAKQIKLGDFFIPQFDSIEGRCVVNLVKNNTLEKILKLYDQGAIGLDQMIAEIRSLTGESLA